MEGSFSGGAGSSSWTRSIAAAFDEEAEWFQQKKKKKKKKKVKWRGDISSLAVGDVVWGLKLEIVRIRIHTHCVPLRNIPQAVSGVISFQKTSCC
jgi:hypothetical protein